VPGQLVHPTETKLYLKDCVFISLESIETAAENAESEPIHPTLDRKKAGVLPPVFDSTSALKRTIQNNQPWDLSTTHSWLVINYTNQCSMP
jgi:hypothetical protein